MLQQKTSSEIALVSYYDHNEDKPFYAKVQTWFLHNFWKSKEDKLEEYELKVLHRFVSTSCWSQFIELPNHVLIRTLKFDQGFVRQVPPIVLLHGFASGLATWAPCFDGLAAKCPVYAIDLPGFGRSSRPTFPGSAADIEQQFVDYLDGWREAVGLESFLLLGHGFGGYIATLYAMQHPRHVRHLILAEPWGFSELPFNLQSANLLGDDEQAETLRNKPIPSLVSVLNTVMNVPNALTLFRNMPKFCGEWLYSMLFSGPAKSSDVPDVSADGQLNMSMSTKNMFWSYDESMHYLFMCNSLKPTGEEAFRQLNMLLFWAKNPLTRRINKLDPGVPLSFLYGALTAMDHKTGYEVYHLRPDSYVEVYLVENAGHNIFLDNPSHFLVTLNPILQHARRIVHSVSSLPAGSSGAEELMWDTPWDTMNLSINDLLDGNEGEEETADEEELNEDVKPVSRPNKAHQYLQVESQGQPSNAASYLDFDSLDS